MLKKKKEVITTYDLPEGWVLRKNQMVPMEETKPKQSKKKTRPGQKTKLERQIQPGEKTKWREILPKLAKG